MTELVKEGVDLVERNQRRRVAGRAGEIADVEHDRPHVHTIPDPLASDAAAPCAAAFSRPRIIIGHEDAEVAAIDIGDLVGPNLGVVGGNALDLGELDSIELVGNVKGAVDDIVDHEVLPHLLLVDVVPRPADLLGVVAPVPRLELEVEAVGGDGLLQSFGLVTSDTERWVPEIFQELIDRFRVLGHPPFEYAIGMGVVTQELRLLGAKGQNLGQDRLVVKLVAVVTTHDVGVEDLLAKLAIVGVVEERIDARSVDGEEPLALLTRLCRRTRSALNDAWR